MLFVSRHRQVRLRGEEMVKTALVDAGAFADLIHAHSAVTVVPDQIEGHLEQFLLSITRFSHTPHNLRKLTDQSTGLFKSFPCGPVVRAICSRETRKTCATGLPGRGVGLFFRIRSLLRNAPEFLDGFVNSSPRLFPLGTADFIAPC